MQKPAPSTVIPVVIALLIAAVFACFTGTISPAEWYSPDLNYRLQTEAFMNGDLAIRHYPYAHGYDWNWGNGMQQNWGLGAPLLRLPFEVLASIAGIAAFPDRLVFLFYFALAAWVFFRGIKSSREAEHSGDAGLHLESLFITLICFMNPTFVAMITTRFDVYEEAVAYNCIWALVLAGLLFRVYAKPKIYPFLILCFIAGFAPLIRLTGVLYGLLAVGLASYGIYTSQKRLGPVLMGLGLFLVFPVFQLFTNYVRFGEFFEFGYQRILDMIPVLGYMLKFDYPFTDVSVSGAAKEMFGSLFLIKELNGLDFFQESIHWWQADALRFREYYFSGFSPLLLVFMAAGVIGAFVCRRLDLKFLKPSVKTRQTLMIMGIWALIGFVVMFFFYLKRPAFSSRYALDFMPALVMGASAFVLLGIISARRLLPPLGVNMVLGILILGWMTGSFLYARSVDENRLIRYRPPAAVDLETMISMKPTEPDFKPPLPDMYGVGVTDSNYNIPANLWGWFCYPDQNPRMNSRLVGAAGPTVTLFFGPFECLEVKIKPWREDVDYDVDIIKIKAGTQFLERKNIEEAGGIQTLTFCSRTPGAINKQWNLVTLGLVAGPADQQWMNSISLSINSARPLSTTSLSSRVRIGATTCSLELSTAKPRTVLCQRS